MKTIPSDRAPSTEDPTAGRSPTRDTGARRIGRRPLTAGSTEPRRRRLQRAVHLALGVIAVHVWVDSFVDVRPTVAPTDHLVSGVVPLLALGAFAVIGPRLRAGALACLGALLGVAVLIGMVGAPGAAAARGDVGPAAITGVLAAAAGVALIVVGAVLAHSSRRRDSTRRIRMLRRAVTSVALAAATLFGAVPIGAAYVVANRSGPLHAVADLGAPHEAITLRTADGLFLQAAFVPSSNGAVIILFPGVGGDGLAARARMLVRHGYGVLAVEPRGQSGSDGDPQLLGWTGEPDLVAAIDYLSHRPDVDPGRIGGLGLSVGGELLIQTAAHDTRLAAVVSEGAGTRWFAEDLHTPLPGWLIQVPFMTVATAATTVFCDCLPPERIDHLVTAIAPRPLLLIYTPRGQGGEWNNPRYHDLARPTAELWEIPESTHVGGHAARPGEYEARVVGFFDRHL